MNGDEGRAVATQCPIPFINLLLEWKTLLSLFWSRKLRRRVEISCVMLALTCSSLLNKMLSGAKAYMCYSCSSLDRIECGADFNITFDDAILCPNGAVCYSLNHRSSGIVDLLFFDRAPGSRILLNAHPPPLRPRPPKIMLQALSVCNACLI